jgi:hypothetical protein
MSTPEYDELDRRPLDVQLIEFADLTQLGDDYAHRRALLNDPETGLVVGVDASRRPIGPQVLIGGEIYTLPTDRLDISRIEVPSRWDARPTIEEFYDFMTTVYRIGRWDAYYLRDVDRTDEIAQWCRATGWTQVPQGPISDDYHIYLPQESDRKVTFGVVKLPLLGRLALPPGVLEAEHEMPDDENNDDTSRTDLPE